MDQRVISMRRRKMRKFLVPVLLVAVVPLTGCATLFGGGSNQPVTLQSTPGDASFTVMASSGLQMAQGTTPATVSLPRKHEYQIELSLEGYRPQTVILTKSINGWTWVNLLGPWIIGFGIDFISGAAYKLEPALVSVTLQQIEDQLYAVVRLLDRNNKVLRERKVLIVPQSESETRCWFHRDGSNVRAG
jgi:hypothetical protein